MSLFSSFDLLPTLYSTLVEKGFVTPTEIQQRALPALLAGKSVVGVSETGSGKTLAFGLPLLHMLKVLENDGNAISVDSQPRAAIIVPTRELGEQVSRVLKPFTHTTRLRVRTLLGGTTTDVAKRNVKGPFEILVATPGRLVKFVDRGLLSLSDVRILVFDEADQMLDQGFLSDATRIAHECAPHCQLGLFSATVSTSIQNLMSQLFSKAEVIRSAGSHRIVSTLTTLNRKVVDGQRFPVLEKILADPSPGGTLIFANTRDQCDKLTGLLRDQCDKLTGLLRDQCDKLTGLLRDQCDKLAGLLRDHGHKCLLYRGEMDKVERRANLKSFRDGKIDLLVSTDLASRGLDVDHVDRVINYHLPRELENYLHRVGRTARAGRSGLVVNLVTERDAELIGRLEKIKK
ncbi:MAG: DEAD/DEAH box helicase [Bdellovibrionaceae bacterium]|nr:DEAD/DEAH box helicase [Pseudobdellovibrionaceae bacterium]